MTGDGGNPQGPALRTPRMSRILVPTDFSERAASAVSYASFLAEGFSAAIELLHALALPPRIGMIVPGATLEEDARDVGRVAQQRLDAELEKLRARTFVTVSGRVAVGAPARVIVDEASRDGDLIVMATHGRTGIERVLMGSITEEVVRHARCPVVTVHLRDGASGGLPEASPRSPYR